MKKNLLKILIKEVLREIEDPKTNTNADEDEGPLPSSGPNLLKHKNKFEKEYGELQDTIAKFKLKGINKGNVHILKDFLIQAAHEANMKDLEVIHAEIEKSGKKVVSLDDIDLDRAEKAKEAEDEKKFNITNTKSVTRATSKQKPDISTVAGGPEDWKSMEKRDLAAEREKNKLKNAKIKAGTYDPNDTSLWDDDDWREWEKKEKESMTPLPTDLPSVKAAKLRKAQKAASDAKTMANALTHHLGGR